MLTLSQYGAAAGESKASTTETVVLPTIGTLLATGAVVSGVCRTPDTPFASWGSLLACAVGYLLLAAVVHAAAIALISRVYGGQAVAPARRIMRGMWLPAALLPMTVLLAHAGSAWAAVVLPVIAVQAVLFVRRAAPEAGRSAHGSAPAGIAAGLFGFAEPPTVPRTLWPMLLVALMLELGAVMLASWQYPLAGLLFGLCVTVVLWRMPLRPRAAAGAERPGQAERGTAVALLLTIVALLPSLGGSRMAGMVGRFVGGAPEMAKAAAPPVHAGGAKSGALSGVILTLPPKPREKVLPPPPTTAMTMSGNTVKPRILPFDGAYWYFRRPELEPREDARRVRGDPTKVQIRSTDQTAIQMEAHQRLEPPLTTDCCSAIRVAVRNAEEREGAIGLELILEANSPKDGWRRSLGTVMLPSSVESRGPGERASIEEVLNFPVPKDLPRREFDEMTVVVVQPAGERSRMGAHVAIEHFELVGR